jgi:hypothetical protein
LESRNYLLNIIIEIGSEVSPFLRVRKLKILLIYLFYLFSYRSCPRYLLYLLGVYLFVCRLLLSQFFFIRMSIQVYRIPYINQNLYLFSSLIFIVFRIVHKYIPPQTEKLLYSYKDVGEYSRIKRKYREIVIVIKIAEGSEKRSKRPNNRRE